MKDNHIAILLTGMGIGAAAGFLFARYSGADFRKQIARRSGQAKTFLKDQSEVLIDRVGKAAAEVEHHLADVKNVVRDLNPKAKDIIEAASSVTIAATDEIVDKSRAIASKAGKMIEKQGERLQQI